MPFHFYRAEKPTSREPRRLSNVKNSVAAIYFGLKCPPEKQSEIIEILKGRKWVEVIRRIDTESKSIVTETIEYPIEYYRMELDETHFGKLKAVKIGDTEEYSAVNSNGQRLDNHIILYLKQLCKTIKNWLH